MEKLLTFIILFVSNYTFCQIQAIILDKETGKKIPYVNIWIENENVGTTSNEDGEFFLDNIEGIKKVVFSAIGYMTEKIQSDSIGNVIRLKPQIIELEAITVSPKKKAQEFVIGSFNKSIINHYFACGIKPWITARYFEYKEDYNKTPFLKKINILTNSDVKDSKFNVRLYGINANGEPGNYIYHENIIGIAKIGKKTTEIDISNLNLEFPKEGFFIAIEWLIIDSNKYEYTYTMKDSQKKLEGISYEPSIGTIPSETDGNSWIFNQGKWRKVWKNNSSLGNYKDKYSLLAIELVLTD